MTDQEYIKIAIEEAGKALLTNRGGPFGAIIVNQNGEIVGRGHNRVTSTNDPTAHAEVVAIRDACKNLNTFQLDNCTIYTSCEPCPMCLGAIYWARPSKIVYACSKSDAADIGFDDDFIYREIATDLANRKIKTVQLCREEGLKVFKKWADKEDKIEY